MITKDQVMAITRSLIPLLQDALEMQDKTFECHVGHSRAKFMQAVDGPVNWSAICQPIGDNHYNIYICYNKQRGISDIIGSVVHEMLHARMRDVSLMVKKSQFEEYHLLEEKIVSGLERLFLLFLNK